MFFNISCKKIVEKKHMGRPGFEAMIYTQNNVTVEILREACMETKLRLDSTYI